MLQNSSPDLSRPLNIGHCLVSNRAFLAPMSGVSDAAFRRMAAKFGAGLVVSEMVASEALLEGEAEMALKMQQSGANIHMVQIAGREARWMALAAKMAEENGAQIIDINMGCPARRVTTGYSGSALMRDLDHALSLIEATVCAVEVPVTLKMRLGWDNQSINAPELAKRAEDAGIRMITVHGRTRCQFYKGNADWAKVGSVRQATRLPLVVNGDIRCKETAQAALEASGADAVMVGRGAYGAPWIPAEIAGALTPCLARSLANDPEIALAHHEDMLHLYGFDAGIRQARKHLGWYLDRLDLPTHAKPLRASILTSFDVEEIRHLTREIYGLAGSGCMQREAAA